MTIVLTEYAGAGMRAFSAALFFCPLSVAASEVCMPASALEATLIDWYDERPTMDISDGLVLWQALEKNTWTLVKYRADGLACTMDHGHDWAGSEARKQLVMNIAEQSSGDPGPEFAN